MFCKVCLSWYISENICRFFKQFFTSSICVSDKSGFILTSAMVSLPWISGHSRSLSSLLIPQFGNRLFFFIIPSKIHAHNISSRSRVCIMRRYSPCRLHFFLYKSFLTTHIFLQEICMNNLDFTYLINHFERSFPLHEKYVSFSRQ